MEAQLNKEAILVALQQVYDPDLQQDIVSLGFIKDLEITPTGKVSFKLELTTPACPMKNQMKAMAEQAVKSVAGVNEVEIEMTAQVRSQSQNTPITLPEVKNVICVASGKGGVGKSTVSVNLAMALAKSGATVGILDADIYGPTIPALLGIYEPQLEADGDRLVPVSKYGLKVISIGFLLRPNQAVIWRGPMLDNMVTQFLGGVAWGSLDYLLVDLPPGTGDVQLSICQKISLAGAVIVSTPQDIALNIAQKAIFMFQELHCPILGIIENMSYFVCSHCGMREQIFGNGGARDLSHKLDIPFLGEIPLAQNIRSTSDEGNPVVNFAADSPQAKAFMEVASKLAAQISIRNKQ